MMDQNPEIGFLEFANEKSIFVAVAHNKEVYLHIFYLCSYIVLIMKLSIFSKECMRGNWYLIDAT